jgi:hypothetical protein
MWISRKTYDDLRLDAAKCNAVCTEQARTIATLQATLDWFRVRITQLEIERAQLLFNYTGVKVPTPEIQRAPDPGQQLHALPHFNDVGDDEAKRLGIGWNDDGTVRYGN